MSRSEDLARRIRLGEDSGLELERSVLAGDRVTGPRRDDFADELAALANARGGTVVLWCGRCDAGSSRYSPRQSRRRRTVASRGLQRLFEAAARRGYVPGALANTLTPDSLHLRQASRNELIVSLLARCPAPSGVGHMKMMDRRGDGVPIIRSESRILSGRLPEDTLIDDDELRLVIGTYPGRNDRVPLESVGSTMAASETLSAFAAASSASSAGRSAGASP